MIDHSKIKLSPKKHATNIMDQQKQLKKEANIHQKKVYNELLALILQRVKDEKHHDSQSPDSM